MAFPVKARNGRGATKASTTSLSMNATDMQSADLHSNMLRGRSG
jgi:hypothetical protein